MKTLVQTNVIQLRLQVTDPVFLMQTKPETNFRLCQHGADEFRTWYATF